MLNCIICISLLSLDISILTVLNIYKYLLSSRRYIFGFYTKSYAESKFNQDIIRIRTHTFDVIYVTAELINFLEGPEKNLDMQIFIQVV